MHAFFYSVFLALVCACVFVEHKYVLLCCTHPLYSEILHFIWDLKYEELLVFFAWLFASLILETGGTVSEFALKHIYM